MKKLMISKVDFVEQMNELKKFRADEDLFLEVTGITIDKCQFLCAQESLIERYLKNLSLLMKDEYTFINWWVYETNFGEKNTTVNVEKKKYYLTDASKLYSFLRKEIK
jgi:hypothetical protein